MQTPETVKTMGMEGRGNRVYFYAKERIGDRVVSRYVGSGEIGELAAALSALQRDKAKLDRADRVEERRRHREDDALVRQSEREIGTMLTNMFEAAGYHKHKGQWRKKRETDRERTR